MKRTLKHAVAAIFLILNFGEPVAAGPAEDRLGLERQRAEQGHGLSQYFLGLFYEQGKDVPQDYAEALKWFRLAADQGLANAQFQLGLMYYAGRGVPQDLVRAHMWFNLSTSQGYDVAEAFRDQVVEHMTPAQIAEAQKLARDWKPQPERQPNR